MERNEYLKKCQLASFKTDYMGTWWAVKWDETDLVRWRGELYVPVDYMFGFKSGNVTGVAILHSTKANSVVYAALREVENNSADNAGTPIDRRDEYAGN